MSDSWTRQGQSLLLHLPGVDLPSVNHIYRNIPGRGRALTTEAKRLKAAMTDRLWTLLRSARPLPEGDCYALAITLALPHERLWTKAGRSKRFDVSNRVKLIEDCFEAAVARLREGYNDAQHWVVHINKCVGETGVTLRWFPLPG